MTTRPEIVPEKPHKCPVCGENAKEAAEEGMDIYGEPHDFILTLHGVEADSILVRGWSCSQGRNEQARAGVFGTVLAYMIKGIRTEFISPNHCYMLFKGDRIESIS